MGKIKVPHTFPVPPLNKGTLNSLKITKPSSERSAEQGTFGGSLVYCIIVSFLQYNYVLLKFRTFRYRWGIF